MGLLRLETRGFPASTVRQEPVAPVANVRPTSGVGRPRELPRARTASTIPGRTASDVLIGATRAVGPAVLGIRPSIGDAALLPLHYGAFPGRVFSGHHQLGQMPRGDQSVNHRF